MGLLMEKWGQPSLNAVLGLHAKPADASLFIPLTTKSVSSEYEITLNHETIDLVYQATDEEFATYLVSILRERPRETRKAVLELVNAPKRRATRAA
jgi:hypothetical protein